MIITLLEIAEVSAEQKKRTQKYRKQKNRKIKVVDVQICGLNSNPKQRVFHDQLHFVYQPEP